MSLFSTIWDSVKSVGKSLLSAFNPFEDDDYRNASRTEQDRFKEKIEVIARDESLGHEYRMLAQGALAKIEAYRHAEEMARIEGTTKITLAKIEAIKANLENTSKKELALIQAIERTPSHASELLRHLAHASNEKQALLHSMSEDGSNMIRLDFISEVQNISDSAPIITKQNKRKNQWPIKLIEWAKNNQIPRSVLPRKLPKLLKLKSMDLSNYGLTELPIEFANLINLEELKLDSNHLTAIPEELTKLIHLKQIDVRDNPLTNIPEAFGDKEGVVILNDS